MSNSLGRRAARKAQSEVVALSRSVPAFRPLTPERLPACLRRREGVRDIIFKSATACPQAFANWIAGEGDG